MTAADGEACAVVATAADIICSLRGADLAGWTPPWRKHVDPEPEPTRDGVVHHKEEEEGGGAREELAWPAVARGKRSRSRRESPSASGSAASAGAEKTTTTTTRKKKARRGARGSPASPLDYSGGSGSGSGCGASTSGGEDGAFCSQPQPSSFPPPPAAAACQLAAPAAASPPPPSKVGGLAGRRTILPVPPPRPAGQQRARKKMRLPEIQQMVRSLSVENDALRKEMKALQRACTALSQENGKLEIRLDQSINVNEAISVENKAKPQPEHQRTAGQEAPHGFKLPDLNLPADV